MWRIVGETKSNGRSLVIVECDCGVVETRRLAHVNSGRTKGCKRCSAKTTYLNHGHANPVLGKKGQHRGIGNITRTLFLHYKYGAEKRGIPFTATLQDLADVFTGKCALSGVEIVISPKIINGNVDWEGTTASLDRIDGEGGYEVGNIQWVHKEVNYLKKDLSESALLYWCSLIHAHHEPNLVGTSGRCND